MKAKVIKPFRDKKDGKKPYRVGDVYEGKRTEELTEKGYLEKTTEKAEAVPEMETPSLNHVGGGYYELPNGERVRGKDEAEKALRDLM